MCAAGFGTYRRPLGESRLFIARRLERITTDICRYRSSAGRRHHRLAWVIRRFADYTSMWNSGLANPTDAILPRACLQWLAMQKRLRKRFSRQPGIRVGRSEEHT